MTSPESLTLGVRSRAGEQADSDDALVRVALTEPAAFALLYERYYDRVYRYCRSRQPGHEDAADFAQQVFVRAFESLHRYRPRGSFAAWLFRIAHNLLVDAGRRQRHSTVPWDALPEMAIPAAAGGEPEDAALRSEQIEQLRRAVDSLPQDRRDLLVLRFGAGLSVQEIATVIGKSVSATQMRLSRTLDALRKDY